MHQNLFVAGYPHRPALVVHSAPPDLLAGFWGGNLPEQGMDKKRDEMGKEGRGNILLDTKYLCIGLILCPEEAYWHFFFSTFMHGSVSYYYYHAARDVIDCEVITDVNVIHLLQITQLSVTLSDLDVTPCYRSDVKVTQGH